VLWLAVMALLLATTIWGRLAYWQVARHGYLSQLAVDQHLTEVPLPASRGMIYDRDMRPLAINTTVYDVTLAPDLVRPAERERVAEALAGVLGVRREEVVAKLSANTKFAYVAKRQSKEKADQLRQMRLPGVYLKALEQRSYLPGGSSNVTLASSLLGFVDYQGRGQRGVEGYYSRQLGGRDGYLSTYRDLAGRELMLSGETRRDPVNGAAIVLTLDSNVQSLPQGRRAAACWSWTPRRAGSWPRPPTRPTTATSSPPRILPGLEIRSSPTSTSPGRS
jgi:stage V sporulation protein D (sporulation-specific penicillin-binding protein)